MTEEDFRVLLTDAIEKISSLRMIRADIDQRDFLRRPANEWSRRDHEEAMSYYGIAKTQIGILELAENYYLSQGRIGLARKAREVMDTAEAQARVIEERMGKVFPL